MRTARQNGLSVKKVFTYTMLVLAILFIVWFCCVFPSADGTDVFSLRAEPAHTAFSHDTRGVLRMETMFDSLQEEPDLHGAQETALLSPLAAVWVAACFAVGVLVYDATPVLARVRLNS